ncbi:MAG: energy transducer TonB [Chthoniobacterales bacterium]
MKPFVAVLVVAFLAASVCPAAQDSSVRLAPSGERIVYAPRPHYLYEARAKRLTGHGYFVMHVRQNGTVSRVEVVRSTGHLILDREVVRAFSQWRFRPGSVDKVASPVAFSLVGAKY